MSGRVDAGGTYITTTRAARPAGLRLAEAVFGAGLLVVPPAAAGLAGDRAPVAWLITLLIGASFSACLGLTARSLTARSESIFDVVGITLGGRARRVVLAMYLVGFVIGQGAIAVTIGRLLAYGLGLPVHAYAIAALVLGVTATLSAAGVTLSDHARRVRLAATGLLGLACCALPSVFIASGLLTPNAHRFGAAMFVVLFAGVGWEASARIVTAQADDRAVIRTVAVGAALVSAGYLLPTVVLAGAATEPSAASATPVQVKGLAVLAAAVLAAYCVTNITAAAGFVEMLGGSGVRVSRVGVGAGAIAVVAAAVPAGWNATDLLFGPSLVALLAYVIALCGGIRVLASWRARAAAGVAATLLLAVGVMFVSSW